MDQNNATRYVEREMRKLLTGGFNDWDDKGVVFGPLVLKLTQALVPSLKACVAARAMTPLDEFPSEISEKFLDILLRLIHTKSIIVHVLRPGGSGGYRRTNGPGFGTALFFVYRDTTTDKFSTVLLRSRKKVGDTPEFAAPYFIVAGDGVITD